MRVLIIGLGVTGDAVVRHVRRDGDSATVIEDSPGRDPAYADRAARARETGATVVERPDAAALAELVGRAELLVPSPGVPERHPAIGAARAAGVPVRSEIDLAAEGARRPLVAVTGTNGKTTVTSLIVAMLEASGADAVAAGNIGLPLLDAVEAARGVVVAEVSSFQLVFTTGAFRPRVAVLLNLAPDHLDWHGSFAAYAAAKSQVFRHQRRDDVVVFNADDAEVVRLVADAPARPMPFSLRDDLPEFASTIVDRSSAPRDRANALAAAAAALAAGATPDGMRAGLDSFRGLPHRLRLVAEGNGVRYYDDSKATNPHATVSAVEAMSGPVVLVVGGRNKGLDLSVLRSLSPRLRGVVAIGEASDEIDAAFAGDAPVVRARDMRTAVASATDRARPGDVVVLSPACASFDWYTGYEQRGDDFAREVERLIGRANAPLEGQVRE